VVARSPEIYKEAIHDELEWHWSIITSPFPAPPPHNGMAKTLDAARKNSKYGMRK
jgi:hypothetical protein